MKPMEFLERLKDTALGKRIVAEVAEAEQLPIDRAAWATEYAAVSKEREEKVYAFAAEERRIIEEHVATTLRLHQEAWEAQQRHLDFGNRTGGRLRELTRLLQSTSDPRLQADGPLVRRLGEIVFHLRKHDSLDLPQVRERVRDVRKDGGPYPRQVESFEAAERAIKLAEASAPLADRFRAAIRTIETLALAASKDVDKDIEVLLGKLPKVCPCGQSLMVLGAVLDKPQAVAA